jgi:hypothetical protein
MLMLVLLVKPLKPEIRSKKLSYSVTSSNLMTEDMIFPCLIRAIAQLREW